MENAKKRVGIITFHDTLNYGATLQCYALQEVLHNMGAEVQVIDYKCPVFEKVYSPFFVSAPTLRKFLYMLAAMNMNLKKQKKKRDFQKRYIRLSQTYSPETIHMANAEYDIFIAGSDQIWNWQLTGFDKTYFLGFVRDDKKKYAYAASFGVSSIEEEYKELYKKYLEKFTRISVRESSGAGIVKELIGIDPPVVEDPVFLLPVQKWNEIAALPNLKDYILLYSFKDTLTYRLAKKLSKTTGKRLVYLSAPLKKTSNFIKVTAPGPDEFVGWFRNADYIISDTFHGTVLAILFQKPFLVCLNNTDEVNANSRIENLLKRLGLSEQIVNSSSQVSTILEPIDYESVNTKLNTSIHKSLMYLKRIVQE